MSSSYLTSNAVWDEILAAVDVRILSVGPNALLIGRLLGRYPKASLGALFQFAFTRSGMRIAFGEELDPRGDVVHVLPHILRQMVPSSPC
jgi:hypothetical protein